LYLRPNTGGPQGRRDRSAPGRNEAVEDQHVVSTEELRHLDLLGMSFSMIRSKTWGSLTR
jgi:hypothetical protein